MRVSVLFVRDLFIKFLYCITNRNCRQNNYQIQMDKTKPLIGY